MYKMENEKEKLRKKCKWESVYILCFFGKIDEKLTSKEENGEGESKKMREKCIHYTCINENFFSFCL